MPGGNFITSGTNIKWLAEAYNSVVVILVSLYLSVVCYCLLPETQQQLDRPFPTTTIYNCSSPHGSGPKVVWLERTSTWHSYCNSSYRHALFEFLPATWLLRGHIWFITATVVMPTQCWQAPKQRSSVSIGYSCSRGLCGYTVHACLFAVWTIMVYTCMWLNRSIWPAKMYLPQMYDITCWFSQNNNFSSFDWGLLESVEVAVRFCLQC